MLFQLILHNDRVGLVQCVHTHVASESLFSCSVTFCRLKVAVSILSL